MKIGQEDATCNAPTVARSSDRVSFRRPFTHAGLETLSAHYVRQSFKPHAHAEYLIGVITGGVHSVWCRGAQHSVGTGTVMTMRPGDVHHGNAAVEAGWRQRMFYVSEDMMADILQGQHEVRFGGLPDFFVSNRADPLLAARLARIHDAVHASRLTLSRESALSAFGEVITLLANRTIAEKITVSPSDDRACRIVDYLHAHVGEDIHLDTLVSLTGLGRRQTIALFKQRTGLPPHAYHIDLKIRLAQRLLQNGSSPADAAAEAGFADQSHMTRHFKAVTGVTPALYARA